MSPDLETNLHATTKAFVEDGWSGKWTLDKATAHKASDGMHVVLPSSQNVLKRTFAEWEDYFKNLQGLIWDTKMEMHDYTCDVGQRKTVCWSSLMATTPVGPYTNEYVWFLTFNEDGTKITSVTEFMDGKQADGLRSRLREADLLHHR